MCVCDTRKRRKRVHTVKNLTDIVVKSCIETGMSASVNYNAERVVMLSELKTVKEKEKYYQLLLQSGCKFVREEIDGK